jgi:hypothetical protein
MRYFSIFFCDSMLQCVAIVRVKESREIAFQASRKKNEGPRSKKKQKKNWLDPCQATEVAEDTLLIQ